MRPCRQLHVPQCVGPVPTSTAVGPVLCAMRRESESVRTATLAHVCLRWPSRLRSRFSLSLTRSTIAPSKGAAASCPYTHEYAVEHRGRF